MKKIRITLGIAAMSLAILTVQSCGNQAQKKGEDVQTETEDHSMEHMQVDGYACSMHPEITGKEGDKCSKCGMDLTPINHDNHEGHNH